VVTILCAVIGDTPSSPAVSHWIDGSDPVLAVISTLMQKAAVDFHSAGQNTRQNSVNPGSFQGVLNNFAPRRGT